jgi:hypothetical protein
MIAVRLRLCVTTRGARKNDVVIGVDVAVRALCVVMRDLKICVIERSPRPRSRRMACRASGWVASALVIRIVCPVVVRGMAAVAVRRHRRVVVVHMATGAGNGHVGARQRKHRLVVIEYCTGPVNRCVAGIARVWKTCLSVRRVIRRVVVRHVTSLAGRVRQ